MFDVTLSFDNGPDPAVTPAVLDVLEREQVKASFFVIGAKAVLAREICVRAHEAGHWLGNHTWSHTIPLGLRTEPEAVAAEIARTEILLGELRRPERLFRPFAGKGRNGALGASLLGPHAVAYLVKHGFTCVLWNVVAREWEQPDAWVAPAVALCAAQQHALIVLHDLPNGAMAQLPHFIEAVRRRGGRFRQDFPPACVPILRGEVVRSVDAYMPAGGRA